MDYVTKDEFRTWEQHEGSSELSDSQVNEALDSAKREIIRVAAAGTVIDEAIRYAQMLLTLRNLLPTINKIRNGGIPVREQDGSETGANVFESFSKETLARMDYLKTKAYEELEPYRTIAPSTAGAVYRQSSVSVRLNNEW